MEEFGQRSERFTPTIGVTGPLIYSIMSFCGIGDIVSHILDSENTEVRQTDPFYVSTDLFWLIVSLVYVKDLCPRSRSNSNPQYLCLPIRLLQYLSLSLKTYVNSCTFKDPDLLLEGMEIG